MELTLKLDKKNRITLPKWALDYLGIPAEGIVTITLRKGGNI